MHSKKNNGLLQGLTAVLMVMLLSGLGRSSQTHRVLPSGFSEIIELSVKRDQDVHLQTQLKGFTAFVLEFPEFTELDHFMVGTDHGRFEVEILSRPQVDEPRRSALFHTDQSSRKLLISTGNYSGPLKVFLMGATPLAVKAGRTLDKKSSTCSKPDLIRASEWRKGLPEPVPGRTLHKVDHLIVHHSAGSNSITDYTLAVRNIYLYHTEVNGWDDVGYNYLIAPNGGLYQGRDDLGVGPEDNVKAAHFCGKNSGTMGVCVLGNYEEAEMSDSAFHTLKELLSWKCVKEQMDPRERLIHPPGSSDSLTRVAGHRDGCATRCPGDNLYRLLPSLIDSVYASYLRCLDLVSAETVRVELIQLSPNPVRFPLLIPLTEPGHSLHYRVFTLQGAIAEQGRFTGNLFQPVSNLAPGYYYLEIRDRDSGKCHLAKMAIPQY